MGGGCWISEVCVPGLASLSFGSLSNPCCRYTVPLENLGGFGSRDFTGLTATFFVRKRKKAGRKIEHEGGVPVVTYRASFKVQHRALATYLIRQSVEACSLVKCLDFESSVPTGLTSNMSQE